MVDEITTETDLTRTSSDLSSSVGSDISSSKKVNRLQRQKWHPIVGLLFVAVLWGLTFPLIKSVLEEIDAFSFLAMRFALGAVTFFPVLVFTQSKAQIKAAFWPGVLTGLIDLGTYLPQTLGMMFIPATRAAFITGTNVVIVPFLSPLFKRGKPGFIDIFAALAVCGGLFLISDLQNEDFSTQSWIGDLLLLFNAFMYAFWYQFQCYFLNRGRTEIAMTGVQVITLGLVSLILGLVLGEWDTINWNSLLLWGVIVFTGFITTSITFWLVATWQKMTTPEITSLLLGTEPVWGAISAVLILGETVSAWESVGATIIMLSVIGHQILSTFLPMLKGRNKIGALKKLQSENELSSLAEVV